jgi:hypothetical protein
MFIEPLMKIPELKAQPNWQATDVDSNHKPVKRKPTVTAEANMSRVSNCRRSHVTGPVAAGLGRR